MTQSKAEAVATDQRRKPRKRRANHVDLSVGSRLRQARLLAGASQEDVGTAIGVSFQAVQKYENGENRLSAGRLAAAAKFLGVPMSFFFQDDSEPHVATDTAGFTSKEIELVRHFRAIRSDDMRDHLLRLTRIISEQNLGAR
ncbi:MAG TPA: helix-turn-helix transcriptional regulator [Stellaceae bacterium]|jgi:transcriptional regulator with XRE-family HTH domain|nr:helix-turn-helix transcriptional regulator [Stellaceae bacterium]